MAQQEGLYSLIFFLRHVHDTVEIIEDVLEIIDMPHRYAAAGGFAVAAVIYAVDVVACIEQALGDVIVTPRVLRYTVRQNHRTAWACHLLLPVVDLYTLTALAIEVAILVRNLLVRDGRASQYIWLLVCRWGRCLLSSCANCKRSRYRHWCRHDSSRRQASGYMLLHHHRLLFSVVAHSVFLDEIEITVMLNTRRYKAQITSNYVTYGSVK